MYSDRHSSGAVRCGGVRARHQENCEICKRVGHHWCSLVFASRPSDADAENHIEPSPAESGAAKQNTSSMPLRHSAVTISTSNGMDVAGGSSSWLDGKKILLTGATGYLGKVICEKLLRECVGIRKVYILVRAKETEDIQQRTARFKDDVVFDRVKSLERGVMDRVVPIEGDLSKVNLELQDFDRDVLKSEVNVVIHAGSNSDLYVGLREAILTNVRGTKYVLQLAESMTRLESFVYVSHVFSNSYERIIGERIYPPRFEPNDMIRIQEERKDFDLEPQILRDFTNFYLFSHHLAESLVARSAIPSTVARLSTLSPSLDEPYSGWIDTSNHLDNLLMFTGNGSVQSLFGKRSTPVDIIPVDLAAKGIITVAQKRATQPSTGTLVFNLTDCGIKEISWETLINVHRKMTIENPLETVYWYPGATIYSNYCLYMVSFVLFQIIPAIIFDALSFLCTGNVHFVRTQLELFQQLAAVERFFSTIWMFDTENADELFDKLSYTEKLKFKFRTQHFNLEEYVRNWNYGRRAYLLQVEQKASRVARWKMQGCYILGIILKTVLVALLGHELLKMIGCAPNFGASSSAGDDAAESGRCSRVRSNLFSTFQKI